MKETFFFQLSEKRQHFLSQNNLSPCLTRLSAIFTQLKLQMIYFQLHCSLALWHMVLSITQLQQNRSNRPVKPSARQREQQRKMERKKIRKASQRGAEEPNSYFFGRLAFVVRASEDTQQRERNYWAFIKQTAGPLQNLKAAAKQPTRKISWPTIAVFLYERHSYRDVLGICAAAKKQNKLSVRRRCRIQLWLSDLHFASHQGMDVTFERPAALGIWA